MARQLATTGSREAAASHANGSGRNRARPVFRPRVDLYEKGDSVVILAEMPGVGPDGVDVTLERGVLTIRGRMPEAVHDGYRQVYAEYGEGDYEGVFTLSEEIDREGIRATQKDGLLTLELPKAAGAKARRIEIKTA